MASRKSSPSMVRPLVPALLVLALAAPLAGCLECEPKLDVRHCATESAGCAPRPQDKVADWNPDLSATFPDVARANGETPPGEHAHPDWTETQERAWWEFWGVPLDQPEKQIFLRHDGEMFRVRVLEC